MSFDLWACVAPVIRLNSSSLWWGRWRLKKGSEKADFETSKYEAPEPARLLFMTLNEMSSS